jgi:hypothetical protein
MRLGPFGRTNAEESDGAALREWRRLKAKDDELRKTQQIYDMSFSEQRAWNERLTRAAVAAREEQEAKGQSFPP